MHELFANILAKRDLSRAGELFNIEDYLIVDCLTDVFLEISTIISQPQYLDSTNDQSVIEICLNRCTSCIRETDTAEKHCAGLVQLLETCYKFNHKPSMRGEDPPHAKVSSDVISCIFLNYNKRTTVMEASLPTAVKFLNKENKEMSKNLASYLSLAAIEHTNLLVPHTEVILRSLINGNYSLARVILQLYQISNESSIEVRTSSIIDILSKCEDSDKNILLQLIENIISSSNNYNNLILEKLPQFFDLILTSTTTIQTLTLLLKLARKKPSAFNEYVGLLILTAQKNSSAIPLVGQILAAIGMKNKEKAYIALEFIMGNLPHVDRASQTTLLQEAVKLCSQYPILFNDKLTAVIRQRNLSQQSLNNSIHRSTPQLMSGNITIVNLNSSTLSTSRTYNISTANNNMMQQQQQHHPPPHQHHHQANNSIPILPIAQQNCTRRNKFDSRSTNRLHSGSNTRITVNSHANNLNCIRLSSSQHINQQSVPRNSPTIPPPLSHNVMITGEINKWGLPSTKITSDGLELTHHVSPPHRVRPFSQGTFFGSSNGIGILNQSVGNISNQNNNNNMVSVHHVTPSISSLAIPPTSALTINQIAANESTTLQERPRKNATSNKSVTLLNVNNFNHRLSVFSPSVRDTIQHFCEKHLDKIKSFMKSIYERLPPAAKCTIEERKSKKFAKIHFACQARTMPHCLYSKTFFSMRTKFAKTWIHLMFLDLQSRSDHALSSHDPSVSSLKHCWDTLRIDPSKSFITLVTSAFPPIREQDALIIELRHSGFFDVFESGPVAIRSSCNSLDQENFQWACFLCNHPEKATLFLENKSQPVIEGQLKEKKGKWRLFKRWRTRYFTLSGAQLSYKNSIHDSSTQTTLDVNQIRSVKVSRSGARNIPTCFEIFTGNQTLMLKPTDGDKDKAEEWVQYLSIMVAKQRDV